MRGEIDTYSYTYRFLLEWKFIDTGFLHRRWINRPVCQTVSLPVYPSIPPSVRPSVRPSVCPAVCLSVLMFINVYASDVLNNFTPYILQKKRNMCADTNIGALERETITVRICKYSLSVLVIVNDSWKMWRMPPKLTSSKIPYGLTKIETHFLN